MAVDLRLNPNGPAAKDIEVRVSSNTAYTECDTNETLWTKGMSNCATIATINRNAGKSRTMIHISGGYVDDMYFRSLGWLAPTTTVLMAVGSQHSARAAAYFQETVEDGFRQALALEPDKFAKMVFVLYPSDPLSSDFDTMSLVLQANGEYGRIHSQLTADAAAAVAKNG